MTNPRAELAALLEQARAYVRTEYGPALKSVNEVLREYEDTLTRFCFDVLRGGDAVDFRRAHKALLRSVAPEAYAEGLREGGVSQDEMDDDDHAAVRAWLDTQLAHVNDFAAWLASGDPRNSEDKRRQLAERVALWVQALEQLGNQGRAASLGNPMLTMVGDDGEESCQDCQEHKGQRMRMKTWQKRGLVPGVIGNSNYECGGWRCQHYLADKDGNRVLP
jgi:hypothetical protein